MSNNLTRTTTLQYVDGVQELPTDPIMESEAARNLVGRLGYLMLGKDLAKSVTSSLSFNLVNFALTLGGVAGEQIYVQGRMADDFNTAVVITVDDADGSQDRYDLISIQYAEKQVDTTSRNVDSVIDVVAPADIYYTYEGVNFSYTPGTPGAGGAPATPGGYEPWLVIKVPATAVVNDNSNVEELALTPAALLALASALIPDGYPGSPSFTAGVVRMLYSVYDVGYKMDLYNAVENSSYLGTFWASPIGASDYLVAGNIPTRYWRHQWTIRMRVKPGAGAQTLTGPFYSSDQTTAIGAGSSQASSISVMLGLGQIPSAYPSPLGGSSTLNVFLDDKVATYSYAAFKNPNPDAVAALDSVLVGGVTGGSHGFGSTWSVTVPDDGKYHHLDFRQYTHITVATAPEAAHIRQWPYLPTNSGGGLDATKFAFLGPPTTVFTPKLVVQPGTVAYFKTGLTSNLSATYYDASGNVDVGCTFSWTANAGSIGATGARTGLNMTGVGVGTTVTVTCTAHPSIGGSAVQTIAVLSTPYSVVQVGRNSGAGSSLSVPFGAAVSVGNTVLTVAAGFGPSVVTFSDPTGFTRIEQRNSGNLWSSLSLLKISGGTQQAQAAAQTINAGVAVGLAAITFEIVGLVDNPVDAYLSVADITGTARSLNSGDVTTTAADDMIIGWGISTGFANLPDLGFSASLGMRRDYVWQDAANAVELQAGWGVRHATGAVKTTLDGLTEPQQLLVGTLALKHA